MKIICCAEFVPSPDINFTIFAILHHTRQCSWTQMIDIKSNATKGRSFCDNERFNFRLRGCLHLFYKIKTYLVMFSNFDMCLNPSIKTLWRLWISSKMDPFYMTLAYTLYVVSFGCFFIRVFVILSLSSCHNLPNCQWWHFKLLFNFNILLIKTWLNFV